METIQTKQCVKCKNILPLTGFSRALGYKDRLCPTCKSCQSIYMKEYHAKPERKEYMKGYRLRPEIKEYQREYNKEYHKEYNKKYHELPQYKKYQKKYLKTYRKKYYANRIKNNIQFKLAIALRNRLNHAIKNGQKTGSAVRDLGCSVTEFKTYLESKFKDGMTWENWDFYGWAIYSIQTLFHFFFNKI